MKLNITNVKHKKCTVKIPSMSSRRRADAAATNRKATAMPKIALDMSLIKAFKLDLELLLNSTVGNE